MNRPGNDSSHWREFGNNKLSHSMAHYLMAIDTLRDELGYVRATDVAEMFEVSRGAASMALSQLKKRGWVTEDPNRFLLLSEQGKYAAGLVEQNYVVLSKFFEKVLSVDKNTAMVDACKMEHLMSIETGTRLLWFMRYLLSNEDLAVKLRERMEGCRDTCDLAGTDECPVCGGHGECVMQTQAKKQRNNP